MTVIQDLRGRPIMAEVLLASIALLGYLFYVGVYLNLPPLGMHLQLVPDGWQVVEILADRKLGGRRDLHVGDVIVQMDGEPFERVAGRYPRGILSDRHIGEVIPLVLLREGQLFRVGWTLPGRDYAWWLTVALMGIGLPFWLAGMVQSFMRMIKGQSRKTNLLAATLWYGYSIWLTTGLMSWRGVYYSTEITRGLSWLLLPVALHVNWLIPRPLSSLRKEQIIPVYLIAALMTVLELAHALPGSFVFFAVFLHLLAIMLPPMWRLGRGIAVTESRLMFSGISMAAIPGMIWTFTSMLGQRPPSLAIQLSGTVTIYLYPLLCLYAQRREYRCKLEEPVRQVITTLAFISILVNLALLLFLLVARSIGEGTPWAVGHAAALSFPVIITVLLYGRFSTWFRHELFRDRLDVCEFIPDQVHELGDALFRGDPNPLIERVCRAIGVERSAFYINGGRRWHLAGSYGEPEYLFPKEWDGPRLPEFKWAAMNIASQRGDIEVVWILGPKGDDPVFSSRERRTLDHLAFPIGTAAQIGWLMEQQEIEVHEHERILLAAEREGQLAALGRLAANVAHELNTPLQTMLNSLELATEDVGLDSPAYRWLQSAQGKTIEMGQLLDNILRFAQPGGEFQEVNLSWVLLQTLSLIELNLYEGHVNTKIDIPGDLPPIWGDAGLLKQVFSNIIINALDAMSDDETGTLSVSARYVTNDGITVSIGDTGCGIPSSELDEIWLPWHTTKAGGSGLGLSIVYGIIERHRGIIYVESAEGEGSTFHIWLPISTKYPRNGGTDQ